MIAPIRLKCNKLITPSVQFDKDSFANEFFSRLKTYFEKNPADEAKQDNGSRRHDVLEFKTELNEHFDLVLEMNSIEASSRPRKPERFVDVEERSVNNSPDQVFKKPRLKKAPGKSSTGSTEKLQDSSSGLLDFKSNAADIVNMDIFSFLEMERRIYDRIMIQNPRESSQKMTARTMLLIVQTCLSVEFTWDEFGLNTRKRRHRKR